MLLINGQLQIYEGTQTVNGICVHILSILMLLQVVNYIFFHFGGVSQLQFSRKKHEFLIKHDHYDMFFFFQFTTHRRVISICGNKEFF